MLAGKDENGMLVKGRLDTQPIVALERPEIDARDDYSRTALIWAAQYGRTDAAQVLLGNATP